MLHESFVATPVRTRIRKPDPKPTEGEKVALQLEEAAEFLEKHGWTRGAMARNGRHCTLGAIYAVSGSPMSTSDRFKPVRAFAKFLYPHLDVRDSMAPSFIADWNDRQKDRRVVLRKLREAAARIRG